MQQLTEREIRALAVVVSQAHMQLMLADPRPGLAFIQSAVDLPESALEKLLAQMPKERKPYRPPSSRIESSTNA